jgi:hypothetical protein
MAKFNLYNSFQAFLIIRFFARKSKQFVIQQLNPYNNNKIISVKVTNQNHECLTTLPLLQNEKEKKYV